MQIQNVIDIGDFPWPVRKDIYDLAALLKQRSGTGRPKDFYYKFYPMRPLRGKKCLAAFWEASTRTAIRSVNVAQDLGMQVDFIPDFGKFSSVAKGEDVRRTVRNVGVYYDLIVMRHDGKDEIEAPKIAVEAVKEFDLGTAIINGGDGDREHPTQALLDEFTIFEKKGDQIFSPPFEKGRPGGIFLNIALIGDVKYSRTIHSLAQALADHSNIKMTFVTDHDDCLPLAVENKLKSVPNCFYNYEFSLFPVCRWMDVGYFTRYQVERRFVEISQKEQEKQQEWYNQKFGISQRVVEEMGKNALILHPMPIKGEIPAWFDKDPRAYYYQQADNGYFVQVALQLKIFRELSSVKRFFSVIGWEEKQ